MPSATHCDACALPPTAGTPAIEEGALIDGRYRLRTALGRGAFGIVYRAEDVHLKRLVAIKIELPAFGARAPNVSFEAEAAALASIQHANVVDVHAFGTHGGAPFFVMEHVAGSSLEKILRAHREHGAHAPVHTVLHVVQQIALGLGAAHAAGLVHRDVKPENVIVEQHSGRPVLVDFGIAVPMARQVDDVIGTAAYMPPEAMTPGASLSPASDQYSLACMAFELLTGRLPFEADTDIAILDSHVHATRPLASSIRPELAPCDEVLERGMARDPTQRWPSCVAFADALAEVVRSMPAPPAGAPEPNVDAPLAARRILVVEDDPVAVRLLSRAAQVAFLGADVAVSRARTGPDAVANAERARPALVVLDYNLPGIDGVEVLSRIRAMPGVAVLVASGEVSTNQRWRFSILGVRDFVDKPLDFALTVETIASIGRRQGWIIGPAPSPTRPVGRAR